MESREERIKLLSSLLNKEKIEKRCNGAECSDFYIYNDKIKINNMVIGYIRPKKDIPSVDFYGGNLQIVTIDIEVEKDLNNENLDLRIGNGTQDLIDMETLNVEEYVENMIEDFDKETVFDMLKYYDCSPSELVDCYIENTEITEIVGDLDLQCLNYENEENHEFGLKFSSYMDLDSIIKYLREDEQLILFDDSINIIDKLKKYKYTPFEKTEDLTMSDIKEIAELINSLVKDNFEGKNVIQYILDENINEEE